MTLKAKAALTYIFPLLMAYGAVVVVLSVNAQNHLTDILWRFLPASSLSVICALVQDVVPGPLKEFFVFFRFRNRLPGYRAYSKVCVGDGRIPEKFLAEMRKRAKGKPAFQNNIWYEQYREVSAQPSVLHENLRYIAWRDLTATLVLLAALSPTLFVMSILSQQRVAWLSVGCIVVGLLTGTAARNVASALVRNVVAITASKRPA